MKKIGGFVAVEIVLGIVAFVLFVGAVYINVKKEDGDIKKFADAHSALLKEVEAITKNLEDFKSGQGLDNKNLIGEISELRSRISTAEHLSHKVAVDAAKKPTLPAESQKINVVIYDKRALAMSKKLAKKPTQQTEQTKRGH